MSDVIILSELAKARMLTWVQALESDEYEQGQGYLEATGRDGTVKHCCLGVLCRLAMADGVQLEAVQFKTSPLTGLSGTITAFGEKPGFCGLPPAEVHDWLSDALLEDVPNNAGAVSVRARVIRMNDDGEDFHAIAAKLREWYDLPKPPTAVDG